MPNDECLTLMHMIYEMEMLEHHNPPPLTKSRPEILV
jgi:hypothetical protein